MNQRHELPRRKLLYLSALAAAGAVASACAPHAAEVMAPTEAPRQATTAVPTAPPTPSSHSAPSLAEPDSGPSEVAVKALVVYDTKYGNTEKIAQAIGEAIGGQVRRVGEVSPADLKAFTLLIVGSPTHGGFPTPEIDRLLKASPALAGVNVAAFDTRTQRTVFGYAAPRIARRLEKSGGNLVASAEGFLVLGMEGPLKAGELERAAGWAKGIAS